MDLISGSHNGPGNRWGTLEGAQKFQIRILIPGSIFQRLRVMMVLAVGQERLLV